jgi:hypothetical protein
MKVGTTFFKNKITIMKKILFLGSFALTFLCVQTEAQSTQSLVNTLISQVERVGVYEPHVYNGYFETKTLKRIVVEKTGFIITVTRELNNKLRCVMIKNTFNGATFIDWHADGFNNPILGWDAYRQSFESGTTFFLTAQNSEQIETSYRNSINAILQSF